MRDLQIASDCPAMCCSNMSEVYQPKQMDVLKDLTKKGRNFMISWYAMYPWITLCLTKKKVFAYTIAIQVYTKHLHSPLNTTLFLNIYTIKSP